MEDTVDKSVGIVDKPIQVREGNSEQDILKEASDRAVIAYEYWKENMDRAEQNLHFIFGEHYSQEELKEKELDNRIAMTFNKLPQFINKVTGSQRSSVQTIKVSPTGASIGMAEPEFETGSGKKKIPLSRILTDLIRDIEYQSNAISWYKTAFKHSLEGGFGWLRVLTEYQPDGFDLDIRIKGLRDRWSVIPDPNAIEADLSDMNYCFITEKMSLKEFNRRYPNKSHEAIAGTDIDRHSTFWGDEDSVTVSEYFRREPYKKTIVQMSDNKTYNLDDIKDLFDEMADLGITEVKRRETTDYKVIWSKISQGDVLEEEIEFPTSTIPIVPVMGREHDFRGKRMLKGLVDDGIDAQVALNKMRSSAIERIDGSPLSPFIATDKAIEGYEEMWAEANTVRYSTLVYKKGEDRPQRDIGATIPTAELQITGVLDEDMKASIGIFNASLGETSNEISGKAIQARQAEADVGTYEFIDNYQTAIRRVGILITEMIPVIYDTNRIIRVRGADGQSDTIEINKVITDTETGNEVVVNSLNHGKHTVVIGTGASYETKQEQNATQILELMKANQQVAQVGSDLLVKNLDFADSDVLAERLEKMIPPEFLSKEKQAQLAEDRPEPQPSPEQIKAQSDQQLKQMDIEAKQADNASKLELEKIKLQIAEVNLEKAKVELADKEKQDGRNLVANEDKRRDNVAKGVVEQMKGSKAGEDNG